MIRTLARRIALAERVAAGRTKFSGDCICFPGPEPPSFTSNEQQEAAHRVKCALHGDRFPKSFHLYLAPWRIERIETEWENRDAQYKRAWLASGPPPLRCNHHVSGKPCFCDGQYGICDCTRVANIGKIVNRDRDSSLLGGCSQRLREQYEEKPS